MTRIKKYISLICFLLVLWGCEEEASLEIDSLSVMGDEFFYGQKVKLWMVVQTNDLPSARYTWTADGGRITQPQGLDENTWEAPREAGNYTINCVVDVNGVKESRSHQMWVSSYYFDRFERTPHTFTGNSSALSLSNGRLQTRVNSTSATRGYVQRAFADPELKAPVSASAQIGWVSNFPTDPITVNTNSAENTLWYEWTLNRDPERQDDLFIDNVRFEWYPVGRNIGLPLDESDQPYNGMFRFQQRNAINSVTTDFMVYVNAPELNFAQDELKKLTMTIDAEYLVHIYVEGVEVLNTDAIKNWREANDSKDHIYLNQWRINYVSNSGGQTAPTIAVDEAYLLNDGSILK